MLTDREKQMIDVASENYRYAGSLESIATEQFGLSPTKFWQLVNRLIDSESAVAYRPQAVRLLQNRRRPQVRLQRRL